jgi:hypothetical protein
MKRVVFLVFAGLLLSAACGFAAPDAPGEEKEGTIAGTPIKRAQGGWLGVELKEGSFQLTFYNEKKNPIPADRTSAVFRWPVHYQPNDERTELLPTDNPAVLGSTYPVKPPYAFKLHITVLGGSDNDKDSPESYVLDFTG